MTLDPQVKAFLDQREAASPPAFETLTPDQARFGVILEAVTLGPPEPLAAVRDRRVPGPGGDIPVRIYVPDESAPLPVFVYFHGGGWVVGDVPTHDTICSSLANAAKCLVVSVDYRLAPEHKYPDAAEDAFAATQWVIEHAAEIGGDPRRVAVGGDSAGGNLAAVVALLARDRQAPMPVLQVLIYPITDYNFDTPSYAENADGYLLTLSTMKWFWEQYLPDEEAGREPYASPLRAEDLSGLPPALVITAQYDPLRDEGEAYAGRLREAGVPVTLTRYDGVIHAFFRKTAQFDKAKMALAEVAGALRRAFDDA